MLDPEIKGLLLNNEEMNEEQNTVDRSIDSVSERLEPTNCMYMGGVGRGN